MQWHTELQPLNSKKASGPFSLSIEHILVKSIELCFSVDPILSLRRRVKILRMSFPDMLCPPTIWISREIFANILSFSSTANQSRRKLSIPALEHDIRLVMDSSSKFRKTSSPYCCSNTLLCQPEFIDYTIIVIKLKRLRKKRKKGKR